MELANNEKLMIEAINRDDVSKICEMFSKWYPYDIFKKENIFLFNKNIKYLKYFRGFYYYFTYEYKKAKILMKYNNPFIFLYNYLARSYHELNKYNKAKYYLKKLKHDENQKYLQNKYLSFYYKHKYKHLYYYLKNENKYEIDKKKYFIHLILMCI